MIRVNVWKALNGSLVEDGLKVSFWRDKDESTGTTECQGNKASDSRNIREVE